MQIKLLPRIIDDNDIEVKENEMILVQTKTMKEPSLALVHHIDTTIIELTFIDVLMGNKPQRIHVKEIQTLTKANH